MMKNFKGGSAPIEQWLKNKDTVLFLGAWEQINSLVFNSLEFDRFRRLVGLNFSLEPVREPIEDEVEYSTE